jgi:hypothetical protein
VNRARWSALLGVVMGAAWALVCIVRAVESETRAAAALRALAAARGEAATLASLRADTPLVGGDRDPDLLAIVRAAAAGAGLAEGTVREIAPEADSAASNTGVRRRGVRVVLSGVSVRQVGEFLAAWGGAAPAWRLVSAQLDRRASDGGYSARLSFASAVMREGVP